MANKVERLNFTRKRLAHDIDTQLKIIDALTENTMTVIVLSRKEALEELWSDFRGNTNELENARDWVGTDAHITENSKIREMYIKGLAKINQSMTMFQRRPSVVDPSLEQPSTVGEQSSTTSANQDQETTNSTENNANGVGVLPQINEIRPTINLPPVQIKSFSGDNIEWPEFKATCENTLTTLRDDICRFHYLKGYLQGEAFMKVRQLPMVQCSYNRAWDILKKAYDKERTIINANLKRLFDLKVMGKESAEALTKMLDVTNECIATVNSYGINTDTWDAMLIFILTQRLDENSIQYWEERIQGKNTIPKFTEFIEFLEIRINVLKRSQQHDHRLIISQFLSLETPRCLPQTQITNVVHSVKLWVIIFRFNAHD